MDHPHGADPWLDSDVFMAYTCMRGCAQRIRSYKNTKSYLNVCHVPIANFSHPNFFFRS